jgi:hypothetical protein
MPDLSRIWEDVDERAFIAPHLVPKLIWAMLEDSFVEERGAALTKTHPNQPVDRPTIVWRIFDMTPGAGNNQIYESKGPQYTGKKANDLETGITISTGSTRGHQAGGSRATDNLYPATT